MNKKELVKALAAKADVTDKLADEFVGAFVAVVTEALQAGEKVALVGFGTFEVKNKAERSGFNPITKQAITIAASKAPCFKAGKTLKDAVN